MAYASSLLLQKLKSNSKNGKISVKDIEANLPLCIPTCMGDEAWKYTDEIMWVICLAIERESSLIIVDKPVKGE